MIYFYDPESMQVELAFGFPLSFTDTCLLACVVRAFIRDYMEAQAAREAGDAHRLAELQARRTLQEQVLLGVPAFLLERKGQLVNVSAVDQFILKLAGGNVPKAIWPELRAVARRGLRNQKEWRLVGEPIHVPKKGTLLNYRAQYAEAANHQDYGPRVFTSVVAAPTPVRTRARRPEGNRPTGAARRRALLRRRIRQARRWYPGADASVRSPEPETPSPASAARS